ncbi:MAG: DUF421 domain-containing protein [Paracoccaceae bacterium]
MNDPVTALDLHRMFLGDLPLSFLIEIVMRTVIIYGYTLALLRFSGGRGISQLSLVEFLLVIALGSAVGDAMFYPEVPILHALLVVTLVIGINKLLDVLVYRSNRIEKLMIGRTVEIIRDGIIDTEAMRRLNLGRSELFQSLRESGVENVGAVRRGYLEASGRFSFFLAGGAQAGLHTMPAWQVEPPVTSGPDAPIRPAAEYLCCDCGFALPPRAARTPEECRNCGGRCWTEAVVSGSQRAEGGRES